MYTYLYVPKSDTWTDMKVMNYQLTDCVLQRVVIKHREQVSARLT